MQDNSSTDHNISLAYASKIMDDCFECHKCVRNCSYLEKYCDSPKDLAEQFQHPVQDQLDIPYLCNVCGLCKTICPKDLDIGALCMEARQQLVRLGMGPLPQHGSVRTNQKWGTSKHFTLSLPDVATGKCKRVFFPGCCLPGYSPFLTVSTYNYLRKCLPDTGIVLNCCGTPTYLIGDLKGFKTIFNAAVKQIRDMGAEEIIFACPDCFHTFKNFVHDMKLTTVYQIMAEKGIPDPVVKAGNRAFSIHDSCITRHESDLQESVRYLIKSIGYGIEELDCSREKTRCCGAGGMIATVDPEFFMKVVKERGNESPYDYVTYCAGCRLTFAFAEKPVLHVLDLFFRTDLDKWRLKPPPNPFAKWWNRLRLKKTFQRMKA